MHRTPSIAVLVLVALAFLCSTTGEAFPTGRFDGPLATIDEVRTQPYLVTDQDVPRIVVRGSSQAAVLGVQSDATVTGHVVEVELDVILDTNLPVPDSWSAAPSLETLSVGDYMLYVYLYANGQYLETYEGSFRVEPAIFCGWTDKLDLTANGVSDSFPAALVHDDLLYVFWNETYGGNVRYLTFDGSTWTDGPTIADCRTTSAVGASVFDDEIFVLYSRGTYPVYHLYFKSFDGVAWSDEEPITEGDVFDAYGATAVTYDDLLYVIWKRWEPPDGVRHIYFTTFDGISWSAPTHLAEDGFINSPVGAVVFQDLLHVFYRNGVVYRAFDGFTWSQETPATSMPPFGGSEGASPAVVPDDDRLSLILLSNIGHLYRVDFDGVAWAESRITEEPEDTFFVLNLATARYQDALHLFWGGLYAWTTTELGTRRFPDTDRDTYADECDNCPLIPNSEQVDDDSDGYGEACDCDDADVHTYPGAAETNDGVDNQCPGDHGYGVIDEITGVCGFDNPGDKNEFSWTAQTGATSYEVARSADPQFSSGCTITTTSSIYWSDGDPVVSGVCHNYLVRVIAPNVGSWGENTAGERLGVCP